MKPNKEHAPEQLVGISFDEVLRAQEFLTASTRLDSVGTFALHDAVLVVKDNEGRTRVRESIDPQPGRSAMTGAMWTGLLGLILGGPVGWVAGVAIGAGAGAGTAKVVDLGVTDAWVDWFRGSVQPGTATIVLLVSKVNSDELVSEVKRFAGGELIYASFDDDTVERLKHALGDSASTNGPGAVPN